MGQKQKLSVEDEVKLIWDYLNGKISRSEAARRGEVAEDTISHSFAHIKVSHFVKAASESGRSQ